MSDFVLLSVQFLNFNINFTFMCLFATSHDWNFNVAIRLFYVII